MGNLCVIFKQFFKLPVILSSFPSWTLKKAEKGWRPVTPHISAIISNDREAKGSKQIPQGQHGSVRTANRRGLTELICPALNLVILTLCLPLLCLWTPSCIRLLNKLHMALCLDLLLLPELWLFGVLKWSFQMSAVKWFPWEHKRLWALCQICNERGLGSSELQVNA